MSPVGLSRVRRSPHSDQRQGVGPALLYPPAPNGPSRDCVQEQPASPLFSVILVLLIRPALRNCTLPPTADTLCPHNPTQGGTPTSHMHSTALTSHHMHTAPRKALTALPGAPRPLRHTQA